MLSEMQVFNAVRRHLHEIAADVLQLVAPGGQAPLGLTFNKSSSRRTVFPDLLAVKGNFIIVGEMKPRYSKVDHVKLLEIKDCASDQVFALIERRRVDLQDPKILILLCHSQVASGRHEDVGQWIFDEELRAVRIEGMPF